jgi:hypothetical protein
MPLPSEVTVERIEVWSREGVYYDSRPDLPKELSVTIHPDGTTKYEWEWVEP